MADIADVQAKVDERMSLWTRMDADKDLYYLKSYVLKDAKGLTVDGIANVTLNLPATFAAHVQSALMAATQQAVVTGEGLADEFTHGVERFLEALFQAADERLMDRGEPRLRPFITEQLDIRGSAVVRVTTRTENGVFVPDFLPIDARWFVYEMGRDGMEWGAYITWRSPAAINQEYPGANAKGRLPIAITDFWDRKANTVYMGGSVSLGSTAGTNIWSLNGQIIRPPTPHPYGAPPFALQVVPLGSMLKDTDALSHYGESVFFLIRDLIPEFNRLASILQTNNMASVIPALEWGTKEGTDATPPESFPIGSVTASDIGGGARKVPTGDLTAAGRLMHDMLSRMIQAGSLSSTDFGNLTFPLSAVALIELGESSSQVFLPRLGSKGLLFQKMAQMAIGQIIASGVSQVDLGGRGHRQTFKTSELRGDYDIEYQYYVKSPQTDVARYAIADSARVFLDDDTILRDILQVEDPTAIQNKKRIDDAAELSPGIRLYRAAKALLESGRTVEAMIVADEMGLSLEQLKEGELTPKMPKRPAPQPARNIAMPGTRAESNTRAAELTAQPRNGSREE